MTVFELVLSGFLLFWSVFSLFFFWGTKLKWKNPLRFNKSVKNIQEPSKADSRTSVQEEQKLSLVRTQKVITRAEEIKRHKERNQNKNLVEIHVDTGYFTELKPSILCDELESDGSIPADEMFRAVELAQKNPKTQEEEEELKTSSAKLAGVAFFEELQKNNEADLSRHEEVAEAKVYEGASQGIKKATTSFTKNELSKYGI